MKNTLLFIWLFLIMIGPASAQSWYEFREGAFQSQYNVQIPIISVNDVSSEKPLYIQYNANCFSNKKDIGISIELDRDGYPLFTWGYSIMKGSRGTSGYGSATPFTFIDLPGEGSHIYEVRAFLDTKTDAFCLNPSLIIMEK